MQGLANLSRTGWGLSQGLGFLCSERLLDRGAGGPRWLGVGVSLLYGGGGSSSAGVTSRASASRTAAQRTPGDPLGLATQLAGQWTLP